MALALTPDGRMLHEWHAIVESSASYAFARRGKSTSKFPARHAVPTAP